MCNRLNAYIFILNITYSKLLKKKNLFNVTNKENYNIHFNFFKINPSHRLYDHLRSKYNKFNT